MIGSFFRLCFPPLALQCDRICWCCGNGANINKNKANPAASEGGDVPPTWAGTCKHWTAEAHPPLVQPLHGGAGESWGVRSTTCDPRRITGEAARRAFPRSTRTYPHCMTLWRRRASSWQCLTMWLPSFVFQMVSQSEQLLDTPTSMYVCIRRSKQRRIFFVCFFLMSVLRSAKAEE